MLELSHWGRDEGASRGLYGLAEWESGRLRWNLRGGVAGPRESEADRFLALAGELPLGGAVLGMGLARSDIGESGESEFQLEGYVRAALGDFTQITVDIQWLEYAKEGGETFEGLLVTGLRLGILF